MVIALVVVGIAMVAIYIRKKKEREEELREMKGKLNEKRKESDPESPVIERGVNN